jgi:hypothetical protein
MRCNVLMVAICLPLSVGVPGVTTRSASMELRGGGVPISSVVSYRGNANSGNSRNVIGNVIGFGNSGNVIDINNSFGVITPGNSGNSGGFNGGGFNGGGSNGGGSNGGVGTGGSNQENSKIRKRNIYAYAPPIVQTDIAALACGKSSGCPPPLVILHRRQPVVILHRPQPVVILHRPQPVVILHRPQPVVITASATPAGDTLHPRHPMSNGRIEPEKGVPGGNSAGPIDLGGL